MKVWGDDQMYPILFSFGHINIYTHGVMMVLGVVVGALIIFYITKKRSDFIFDLIIYSFLGGFIGARLLYIITYHNQFSSFSDMLFIWQGGLVSFGGMIGGFATAYWFLKSKKENVLQWFDIGIIGTLVGWGIGRIGCLLNGDSVGIISLAKIAIWGRIPTQLFETIWTIIFATVLYLIYRVRKRYHLPDGTVFLIGISGYSFGRIIIDIWRDDPQVFIGLKAGQLGGIIIILISFLGFYLLIKNRKEV